MTDYLRVGLFPFKGPQSLQRTPELKLFVQANLHHFSYCIRSTILFLATDSRLRQRPTNDRLEMVPARSGCNVSVYWLGQSRSEQHKQTGRQEADVMFL